MQIGKLVKTYSEFYYVLVNDKLFTCKARGIFKKDKIKPLVGDIVELEELNDKSVNGNIVRILPRKNVLKRPTVANIDQAVLVFATTMPDPKYSVIDKNLIQLAQSNIDTILCFNKSDLVDNEKIELIKDIYKETDTKLLFVNTVNVGALNELKKRLYRKTSLFTGPSGVGKSSIIKNLTGFDVDTGEISKKTLRGKQTTRHYELVNMDDESFLLDSPGFTAIAFNVDYYQLKDYYSDFVRFSTSCRYGNKCLHMSEPNCMVKRMVDENKINSLRYESYLEILNELKGQRNR